MPAVSVCGQGSQALLATYVHGKFSMLMFEGTHVHGKLGKLNWGSGSIIYCTILELSQFRCVCVCERGTYLDTLLSHLLHNNM